MVKSIGALVFIGLATRSLSVFDVSQQGSKHQETSPNEVEAINLTSKCHLGALAVAPVRHICMQRSLNKGRGL